MTTFATDTEVEEYVEDFSARMGIDPTSFDVAQVVDGCASFDRATGRWFFTVDLDDLVISISESRDSK